MSVDKPEAVPVSQDDLNEKHYVDLKAPVRLSLYLCAIILLTAALYFGKTFFLPLIIALLIAFTLSPIVRVVHKHGVPPIVSSIFLLLGLVSILAVAFLFLSTPIADWIARAPEIGATLEEKIEGWRGTVEAVQDAGDQIEGIGSGSEKEAEGEVQEVVIKAPSILSRAFNDIIKFLGYVALTAVLTVFLLAYNAMLYEKVVRVIPKLKDKKKALTVLYEVEKEVSRYLFTIALINTGLGVVVGIAMWAVGMPTPHLWGILAALLNFLPYVGAIVGVALVTAVALVSIEPTSSALLAPALYYACTTIEGQFITPMTLGRQLSLNPVAIMIALSFFGWLWGIAGIFIAVPMLLVLKVFTERSGTGLALGEFIAGQRSIAESHKLQAEGK